ncbi:MAG: ABC transporter ATP-binding protein [Actinobacteria bacterium]|nr:ABC transporter ATP-binding protein [Actinomycetota bacterium]
MSRKRKVLSVKNLDFSYNQNKVLDNISFSVEEGSFISILGPNGSGKSTLVNLISKVLRGYEGKIEVGGRDIKELNPKDIAKMVAVVPQYTNPGFSFTVAEMVMMGRHPYISRFGMEGKEDFDAVSGAMEKTKILPFANRKFTELSGGEKQRVIMTQALAQDSSILLLDEPTSHLDINFQIEFMNLFLSLNKKENKTIIGIFHDVNLAIQNSKKIMLLKEGRIFNFGSGEDIINRESIKSVFGSDVFIGRNPVTKKLYVSPVFNPGDDQGISSQKANKYLRVHIIGGGGAASPVMNLLHSSGYTVSCGVINTLDTDIDTAQMLGIPYVAEAPFSPISFISQNKNIEFIKSSDVVILPAVEFGSGNFSNLVSVKEAISSGEKVIVIDEKNIRERDHTGGKAEKLYRRIIEDGAIVVKSINQVLRCL